MDLCASWNCPYLLCFNKQLRGVYFKAHYKNLHTGGKDVNWQCGVLFKVKVIVGFICLFSVINESPSGEEALGGWNVRTDLHLSLQLKLTTLIAYRNDHWCQAVWGSQQVNFFFFFFLQHNTKWKEISQTDTYTHSLASSPSPS